MKPILTATGLAIAASLLAGCGSSPSSAPPATSIKTFAADEVAQDLINLIPRTYGGVRVIGMPNCDAPLRVVGDVSLCDTMLKNWQTNTDTIEHSISVTLVDSNGHVRAKVED